MARLGFAQPHGTLFESWIGNVSHTPVNEQDRGAVVALFMEDTDKIRGLVK